METFEWLQQWYQSQTDGNWEHSYGVKIETLDNPGWQLKIDLAGTDLWEKDLDWVMIERSENDWVGYKIKDMTFYASGGPMNLTEIIGIFREMVETEQSKQ
ncbi:MAG: immunity 53 family protein [Flavobacteriales bacterium]